MPLLLILFLLLTPFRASASSLDLLSAIEKAKKKEPRYLSSYYEFQAALTLPKQSRASLLPQLSANYFRGKINYLTAPAYYFNYYNYNFRLSLQQTLFNLPALTDYLQSRDRVKMAEARFTNEDLYLIKRVSEAYFDHLYARHRLKVLEEQKRALSEQVVYIQKLLSAGEATLTDLYDAEARFKDLLFQIVSAERDLQVTLNNLSRLIGETPEEVADLSEDFSPQELSPSEPAYWINQAKSHSPVLKYYLQNQEVAKKEISKQAYAAFPRADLIYQYTKSTSVEYLRTEPISYNLIGVQLTLPLFTGGYITAKKEEALERYKQAEKDYERALSDVTQDVVTYYFSVKSALAQIQAGLVSLKSAELSYEATKKAYKAGLRTIVDILNAETNLFQARLNLLKARYDFVKNLIGLKYTCGVLSRDDLVEINNWLTRN